MIFTNTGLTKDNIIFDFDISNSKSYDSNTGFTLTSLTFWDGYILSDLTLTGYGQTMYDFGLSNVTSLTESKSYTIRDRNLVFNRIGYNDATGNTTFPQIILNTGTEGNSLVLSGGYLTSFFKIPDKEFQLGTYRNGVGFTIDTWIYLDQNTFNKITSYTEGFFLYFGTKAENKFNIKYSASTDAYTNIASVLYNSGFTYDTNNYLQDIEYNSVGFKFNNDKTLSLRYLGVSGLTNEILTDKSITTTGWTNIAFTFRYCNKIIVNCDNSNSSLIDCVSPREGDFKIFVNGKLFFEKDCVEEFFWLKELNTDTDRQIGLPYSINWGGGSWGLKHSFTPSITSYTDYSAVTTATTYVLASGATNILVDGNYGTFEGASGTTSGNTSGITTDVYSSILTATTAITYTGTNSLLLYASPSAITNVIITGFTYTGTTNIISGGNSGSFESTVTGITTDIIGASIITSTTQVFSGTNSLRLFNVSGITSETITNYIYTSVTSNILTDGDNGNFTSGIVGVTSPYGKYLLSGTSNNPISGNNLYYYYDSFGGDSLYSNKVFTFDTLYTLSSNTRYIFSGQVYDNNTYTGIEQFKSLYLGFEDDSEINFTNITSVTYTTDTSANTWVNLIYDFIIPSSYTPSATKLAVKTEYTNTFNTNTSLYFDNFKFIPFNTELQTIINTGFTYSSLTDNLLIFDSPISLESNKRYLYEGKIYDNNSFPATSDTKGIYLDFSGITFSGSLNSENIIFSSVTYTSTTSANTWVDLKLHFQTPLIITGGSQYAPIVKINPTGISGSYNFYFDDFKIIKQDYTQTSSAQTEITGYTYTPLSNIITDGDNGTFESNFNGMSTPLTNGALSQVVSSSNYLGLNNNGGPVGGFSNVNGYSFVRFNTPFNLSANTKYIYSGSVRDFAQTYTSNQNIFLGFLDGFETGCTTVTSITFNSGSTGNIFYNLYYEFITPSANTTGKTLTIKTDNTTLFNTNFFLLFDNFKLIPHITNPQTAFTTSFTFSTLTNNLVVFNTPVNILPNKTYIYQGKFYDDNSYASGSNKNVYLTFSGGLNSEITVVTSVTYTSGTSATTWNDLKLIFITPSGLTGTTSYTPVIKVDYTTGITAGYKFYFDEFSIAEYNLFNLTGLTGYSVTEQILLNKNLDSIIKDNFDGSFYGKIQKLRMYDIDLNFSEIKKNYNYYSTKYGFTKLK
jgi:hypothetical protein